MRRIIIVVFSLLLTSNYAVFSQDGVLIVHISGFEEIEGKVSIGLFSSSEGFPKKSKDRIGTALEIHDSTVSYTFSALQNGEYALAIYHDENSNGELDRNFLGIPSEDYVFSNYAKGSFGPPSFEDAKFYLKDSLEIKLDLSL